MYLYLSKGMYLLNLYKSETSANNFYHLFEGTLKMFLFHRGDASSKCFNRKVASALQVQWTGQCRSKLAPCHAPLLPPRALQVLLVALFTCNKENNKKREREGGVKGEGGRVHKGINKAIAAGINKRPALSSSTSCTCQSRAGEGIAGGGRGSGKRDT